MSVRYEIDEENGVIHATAEGQFSALTWFEARTVMLQDPAFREGLDVLLDLRAAEPVAHPSEIIAKEAERFRVLAKRIGSVRIAVVAPGDLAFGIVRQWTAWLSGSHADIKGFRDLDKAKQWLGLSHPSG